MATFKLTLRATDSLRSIHSIYLDFLITKGIVAEQAELMLQNKFKSPTSVEITVMEAVSRPEELMAIDNISGGILEPRDCYFLQALEYLQSNNKVGKHSIVMQNVDTLKNIYVASADGGEIYFQVIIG